MTDKLTKDMYNQLYNLDRAERASQPKKPKKERLNSKRSRAHRLDILTTPAVLSPEEQMLREREQARAITEMCRLYTSQLVNTENFLRVVSDILEGK
jgi:hypothetical protein